MVGKVAVIKGLSILQANLVFDRQRHFSQPRHILSIFSVIHNSWSMRWQVANGVHEMDKAIIFQKKNEQKRKRWEYLASGHMTCTKKVANWAFSRIKADQLAPLVDRIGQASTWNVESNRWSGSLFQQPFWYDRPPFPYPSL